MIDNILQIIAPHPCYNCQIQGSLLCANCKYDIISEPYAGCIVCQSICMGGICLECRTFYEKAWCVGERHDVLESLINAYKFERAKAAHKVFAELLDETVPTLPSSTIVVPVSTIAPHIRQRGYDHAALVARRFARLRGLPYSPLLKRASVSKQRGASRKERFEQAKRAFAIT